MERKPEWLRVRYNQQAVSEVAELMRDLKLNTVCKAANCPNLGECYQKHTATFMILGDVCTRNCRFCNVTCGKPLPPDPDGVRPAGHRPGRKAGAIVVLVDGRLGLYVERGGRTLLSFTEDPADERMLDPTASALAWALRTARVERMALEKVNGRPLLGTPLAEALLRAGFYSSPSGVRFRT